MNLWKCVWVWTFAASVLLARPAAAAITVSGTASSTGPTIEVDLAATITNTALMSFGVQLNYSPTDLYVLSASQDTNVWFLAANGIQYRYPDPDTSVPGQVVILGGKLDGSNPLQGVAGTKRPLGSVVFGRLSHNLPTFSLALGHASAFANFVTTNGVTLDNLAGGVTFTGVTADPEDTKLVGIPDAWQLQYFGAVGVIWWSDDPDGDGFNNLLEYQADTIPTNSASFLGLSGASRAGANVTISWHGGVQATQVLQRRFSLSPAEDWVNIFTNSPPTSISANYADVLGTNQSAFYRVTAHR